MEASLRSPLIPSYDTVGRYNQDEINGFSQALLDRMLDVADLAGAQRVLDAMAGDGNLSARVIDYCHRRGIRVPELVAMDISEVQRTFAEADLERYGVQALRADVTTMVDLTTGVEIPSESFDRVLIKSALHELPLAKQLDIYRSVMRVLKPGGTFVAMGFLFDVERERDEFREIARCKDTLAGMHSAVVNRHFMTRSEFYTRLEQAGFHDVQACESFQYHIHSRIVAQYYFSKPGLEDAHLEFQKSELSAVHMRRRGLVQFDGEFGVVTPPGEITLARKPGIAPRSDGEPVWRAEIARRAAALIEPGWSVLDLAGASGALGRYDAVVLIDRLNHASAPVELLRRALGHAKPGGRLIVGGPTDARTGGRGHFWSLEGIAALLTEAGCTAIESADGTVPGAYLVVGRV